MFVKFVDSHTFFCKKTQDVWRRSAHLHRAAGAGGAVRKVRKATIFYKQNCLLAFFRLINGSETLSAETQGLEETWNKDPLR